MPLRIFKLLVSWVVWLWDQAGTLFYRSLGLQFPGTCTVLYYHSVPKHARIAFGRQMDLLVKLAQPISVTSNASLPPAVLHAVVTFDDAFSSFVENALPELIARRIPCIVFAPAGCLGRAPAWENPGDVSWQGEQVMTAQELAAVAASGFVTVGAHGWHHRNLPALNESDLSAELRLPKEMLEKMLGTPISSLSFPYGSFGPREIRAASHAGYEYLFCSQPAVVRDRLRPGLIGRVSAEPTDWRIEFKLKLAGAYRWLVWASRLKRRIRQLTACFSC